GERDRHAHLEQRLHEVGAALGHSVGEFLDGDRLRNDHVADLLGRRAGLHMVPLFLLAGAAQRRQRAGAAVVFIGEGASDGELAAMALLVASAAARTGRLGTARRGRMTARTAGAAALLFVFDRCGRCDFGSGWRFGGAPRFFFGLATSLFGCGFLGFAIVVRTAAL